MTPFTQVSKWCEWALGKILPRQFRERDLVGVLVGAIVVLGGFFASPVFRRRVPVHGDLGFFEIPLRSYYARCLKIGEAFDWMPQIFCGYFITGEGQNGFYHPVHWLLYRWLPFDTAFALDVFLPIVVLATGTIVFLRRYVNLAGACMGALVATFSWMFVMHMQQPQITAVVSQTPWLLAAIAAAVGGASAATRGLACVAVAILTASEVLMGHPQALWFSLSTCSLFAFFLLVGERANWKTWLVVVGGIALGILMGSLQLFTTYSALSTATRATENIEALAADAASFQSFWQMIAPYKAWNVYIGNYFAIAPFILALWWITAFRTRSETSQTPDDGTALADSQRRDRAVRVVSWWAFVLVVVTATLALGLRGKLYYVQAWLPILGRIRGPYRYLIVTQFGVAILAALAFARLVVLAKNKQKASWGHLVLPWLAFAASIGLAAWDAKQAGTWFIHENFQQQYITGPLFVGVAVLGLTLATRGHPIGLFLLALLTAIDLGLYSVGTPAGKIYWRREVPRYEEYLAACPTPPPSHEGRILDNRWFGLPVANLYDAHGYRMANGYVALWPIQCLDYRNVDALRVAEVVWRWQPPESDSPSAGLGPPEKGGWRRVPNGLPRVRLVSEATVSAKPGEDLKKINVDTTALVSRPIALTPSPPGTAKLIEDRSGKISVEVDAPQRQLLVVSESYHSGWQASVDSQPAQLERVYGDFFGCVVEKGRHRVDFVFSPMSLRLGKMVSLSAFGVALIVGFGSGAVGLFQWRRSARQRTTPNPQQDRSVG